MKPLLTWPDIGGWGLDAIGDWFSKVFAPVRNWFRFMNGWKVPYIGGIGDLIVIGLAMLFC